ncbi:MAG: regulatory protein GemA [Ruminococcus sp.]|nr:regulatory protein GemA [Ruminococcus sp.]MDE6847726.1 regulatory protein GemA [Ruminococcus sp.]
MTTRSLYAIAANAGLVEHGNKEDPFHQIVYSVTRKTSVKDLTEREMKMVESEIRNRISENVSGEKIKSQEAVPDIMSPAQQALAWRLMYQIRLYDLKVSNKSIGARLAGVVRKTLKISASDTEPLKWVSAENGNKLIETLKRYVKSAEKKYKLQQSQK